MDNRNRLEVTIGQVDTRVTRVEVTVDYIKEDVRNLRTDFRDLRGEFNGLRREFHDLRGEMRVDIRSLQDQARTDFRLLFGAIITVALGMSALMAKGFHWIG